jgi:uncharacterized protein with PIN domain
MKHALVRAYGPLNDFLPGAQQHRAVPVYFKGRTSVKDLVEGLGVPHPEIDLILLNNEPVRFECLVGDSDRVAVFPRFYQFDIKAVSAVHPDDLPAIRFVLDGHLGKLARRLRLVGLDATCPPHAADGELAALSHREGRVLLTRDRVLLKRRAVTHGYFVRETDAHRQLVEVLQRFEPLQITPFSRCLECNTELRAVAKPAIEQLLPATVRRHCDGFQACDGCGRVYWQGSHWRGLSRLVDAALEEAGGQSQRSSFRAARRP